MCKRVLFSVFIVLALTSCGSQKPDLVPANPSNKVTFCDTDEQGDLLIHVENQGGQRPPVQK